MLFIGIRVSASSTAKVCSRRDVGTLIGAQRVPRSLWDSATTADQQWHSQDKYWVHTYRLPAPVTSPLGGAGRRERFFRLLLLLLPLDGGASFCCDGWLSVAGVVAAFR